MIHRNLFSALMVLASLAGCSAGGPTEADINAAIERCVAKNTASPPTTKGMSDELANKFLAAHGKMQREMCEKVVRDTCRRSARQCASF